MIVNVTEEGLELHGEVDHSQFYDTEEPFWWSSHNIRRSIFMGDYIYAISRAGVTVTQLDTLEEVDTLQLVQVEPHETELPTSETTEEEGKSEG